MHSSVESPYIIGIIRSREQELLQTDDYTRLIAAPNTDAAIQVLADTPYGTWLTAHTAEIAFAALTERLVAVLQWLRETVIDQNVVAFFQVRYDGLNVTSTLLDKQSGMVEPGSLSPLGSLDPLLLQSVIFNQVGSEELPTTWRVFITAEQKLLPTTNGDVAVWKNGLLERVERVVSLELKRLAVSPLMYWYAEYLSSHLTATRQLRGEEALGADWQSELDHDNDLVLKLREYNGEPIGYDPIVAYWLTLELEVRTIRLVLATKLQGGEPATIIPLVRNLVHKR